jgi:hypothetical protein
VAADLALARSRGYFSLLGTGPLYPWRPGKGYFPEGRLGPTTRDAPGVLCFERTITDDDASKLSA